MQKRKTLIIVILFTAIFLFSKQFIPQTKINTKKGIIPSMIPQTVFKPQKNNAKPVLSVSKSIFVPYWALGQDDLSAIPYEKVYYFGVSADENGVVKDEPGYKRLESMNCPNSHECVLVLRMLDQAVSEKILMSKETQQKIIKEVLELTDTHFFSGVTLDLEISGIVSDGIKGQINDFVQQFYTLTKINYKTFSFIVYGDSYFRKRPYDMKFIADHSDEIMIMAYDFSKSYGEPGPNFPFDRRSLGKGGNFDYAYDFKQMVADYTSEVVASKLTVIFGMYGYDWTLNDQGTPLKRGEAVTVNQIELKISNLKLKIRNKAQNLNDKTFNYKDDEGREHVVWYEDEESAQVKTDYLMQQGIGKVSYWAWGYF